MTPTQAQEDWVDALCDAREATLRSPAGPAWGARRAATAMARYRRRRRAEGPLDEAAPAGPVPAQGPTTAWALRGEAAELVALRRLRLERVLAEVQRLPARQGRALVLRAVGYTYAEIAGLLRVRPGAVAQLVFRGRERLRQLT